MYRLYLIIILLIISGCTDECDPPPDHEFGELYFELDCAWADPEAPERPALWRCSETLDNDLLKGYIFLELEHSESLYLCGTDLVLYSGVAIYDNLIKLLTKDRFNCLHITEDRNKGNDFDWSWSNSENILQFIWRPDDESYKVMTLVIEKAAYDVIIRSPVYYKTDIEN